MKFLIVLIMLVGAGFAWFGIGTDYTAGANGSGLKLLARDIFAASLGAFASVVTLRNVRRLQWSVVRAFHSPPTLHNPLGILVVILGSWGALSSTDWLVDKWRGPLSLDPDRFERIGAGDWSGKPIGISLSGGGYRAALLHAGVLHELESRGVHVTHISAVSGGSIIGAFYALGGRPEEFRDAVIDGRLNFKRHLLRMENAIPLLCPHILSRLLSEIFEACGRTRVNAQAGLLRRVLLADHDWNTPRNNLTPKIIVNTTDLNNGVAIGFSSEDVLIGNLASGDTFSLRRGQRVAIPNDLTLSRTIAISGAFPGAFPPTEVKLELRYPWMEAMLEENQMLRDWLAEHTEDGVTRTLTLSLSDGGILDNTGQFQLQNAYHLAFNPSVRLGLAEKFAFKRGERLSSGWLTSATISSDGSKPLGTSKHKGQLSAITRAIEVATTPTQKTAIQNLANIRKITYPILSLRPEYFSLLYLKNKDVISERYSITADDGLSITQPSFPMGGPLQRASNRTGFVWQYLNFRSDNLHLLKGILPDTPANRDSFNNFRIATDKLPRVISKDEQSKRSSRRDVVMPFPAWDKDYQSLLNWIETGFCEKQIDDALAVGADCDILEFNARVAADVNYVLSVFDTTDTLKAQFTEEEANAIFRLGRYLVHAAMPTSHAELVRRVRTRQ